MSPTKGTTVRPLRVDQELWDDFGKAATAAGMDRSSVLRDFMKWYSGRPDMPPPERPPAD